MVDLNEINESLNLYIRPQSFPVAISMVSSEAELPKKAKQPIRDFGVAMPVCQGIAFARRYGWTVVMGKEDMLCPLGALTLGFVPAKAKFLDGSFPVPNWVQGKEVRVKFAQNLPRFDYEKYTHIVAAPLLRTDFEPQVILVYGSPAQVLRFVQSIVYAIGDPILAQASGGGACSSYITKAILTDECQLILPGAGDRLFAMTQDHEMAFSIPIDKVERILKGLEVTHEAGLRYPITPYLRFKADFPPPYAELMDYLKYGGEG